MSRHALWVLPLLLAVAPVTQAAEAGRLLFTVGQVEIERTGSRAPAKWGSVVMEGDTVHTGASGRTQIRMNDRSLVALRPATSFLVEAMQAPIAVAAVAPDGTVTEARPGRAVMRLLRGGLRTLSGLVGRASRDEYKLVTPIATIGIRGTDYRLVYCNSDCSGAADGLHIGVSSGAIVLENGSGALDLYDNQYAYVSSFNAPAERQLEPPAVLDSTVAPSGETSEETRAEGVSETQTSEQAAAETNSDSGESGSAAGNETATAEAPPVTPEQPQPELIEPPEATQQSYAYATAPNNGDPAFAEQGSSGASKTETDASGNLIAFDGLYPATQGQTEAARYSMGSASNVNQGFDPVTGLRWGRWSGGTATATTASGSNNIALNQQSLHWIIGPENEEPALPSTGTINYSLVGNTSPTDNLGHVGSLLSASLTANFDARTVSSNLALSINNLTWTASGNGTFNGSGFSGDYSNVTVGGQATGSGSYAGFFTPGAEGAGMSYSLENGSTQVSGAAAFSGNSQGAP